MKEVFNLGVRPFAATAVAMAMAAAVGVIVVPIGGASADPGGESAGERSTVTYTSQPSDGVDHSIATEYQIAETDRTRGAALRQEFLAEAASDGLYYDAGYVDYLKLDRDDDATTLDTVEMVVPRDYRVEEVQVSEEHQGSVDGEAPGVLLEASVTGTITFDDSSVIVPDGPGFNSFTPQGSGQYILRTAAGEMLATWSKSKMTGEKDRKYDYWSYQRKARVTTKNITGPDYGIKYFGIKSFPSTSTPLHHWVDWSPATGNHKGDCNSTPLSLSLSYLGASSGVSFLDCDRYSVAIANSSPGDMSFNWDPGLVGKPKGTREGAFNWIAARAQGGKFTANDFQKVAFYHGFTEDTKDCASTNQSANC
ncbi:hypothetical protein V6U89_17910 [Micromonospora sp. CPCC 206171]|uniref:hypothetical protein n=1 Tax=Micromonospora sp. CPCC 206171 TaxID=3122405 RepID=UPI002FF2C7D1